MHIYYTPRSKYCFLVRIAECAENIRYALDAFFHTEFVGSTSHCSDTFSGSTEYLRVIVFLDAVEFLFGNTFGHKLFPRLRVDERSEVVNRDLLIFIAKLCAINQQRHTDRNTSKNGDSSFPIVLFLFQFFKSLLLFLCQRLFVLAFLLGSLFKAFKFLVLLIGQPLIVNVHLIRLGHGFCLTDNLFEVIELLQFQITQFHQLIIIQTFVLKTVAHNSFHINLFELFQHLRHIELVHLGTLDGDNRAEVQELTHNLTVVAAGLSCLG